MAADFQLPDPDLVWKNIHAQKHDCLDVRELCIKLEAAKREQDEREAASQLRRQVRAAVKNERRSKTMSVIDTGNRQNWYRLPGKSGDVSSSEAQKYGNLPQLRPHLNTFEMENALLEEEVLSPETLDGEPRSPVLSSKQSNPRSPVPTKDRSNWRSFAIFKNSTTDDCEHSRNVLAKEKPTSRRSVTSPLLETRFGDEAQRTSIHDHASVHSDLGFVNEYTVSYDTCDVKEQHSRRFDLQLKPLPIDEPHWASYRSNGNDGMRSFLNLPQALKKDRKDKMQARADDLMEPAVDIAAPARSRHHVRTQTAPEELICEAMTRMSKEERGKKRKSFGGLLQTIFLPNHSMSMHDVTI